MHLDFCIHCAMCGNLFFITSTKAWRYASLNVTLCSKKCWDNISFAHAKIILRRKVKASEEYFKE